MALRGRSAITGMAVLAAMAAVTSSVPAAQAAPADQAALSPGWRIIRDTATPDAGLNDIVATSPGSAWAAGETGAHSPVVFRWQAGRWRAITRPGPTGSYAASVAASSAANVWVALANVPAVDHYDGHQWTRTSFAAAHQVLVGAVTTTGPNDAWVFTYNFGTMQETAHHYNGRRWRSQMLPVSVGGGSFASAVSSASPSDIWAWGYDQATSRYVTLHYDGRSWRKIPLPASLAPPGVTTTGDQVLAESPSDAWASVGAYSAGSVGPVILLHWNGQRWRRVTGKLPAGALTGPIAPDGDGGLWLAAKTTAGVAYFAHYQAGKWTRTLAPAAPGGALEMTALALIPGTHSLWASAVVDLGFGTTNGAAILRHAS